MWTVPRKKDLVVKCEKWLKGVVMKYKEKEPTNGREK